MAKIEGKKYAALLVAVCMFCFMSTYSADAAPKIKSKSVTLNADKVTVGNGGIVTLDAVMKPVNSTDTVKWTSSNKNVATVNKYGVVTAVGEGSATITAKTTSRKKAQCVVTVKSYLTKDEAAELVSQKCLTDDAVKKLIMENTLSEDDVRKIISETSGGNSGGDTDWQEGVELSALSNQSLPTTVNGRTITKISIKKYHYDGEWRGVPQKYKYILEIEGIRDQASYNEEKYEELNIGFTRKDGMAGHDARYYIFPSGDVQNAEDYNTCESYSESNGRFVYTVEQYNIYSDFDEYFISSMEAQWIE